MSMLIKRMAQYVANALLSKTLANSVAFQRFAVFTHRNVTKISVEGAKQLESIDTKKVIGSAGYALGRIAAISSTFPIVFAQNLKREFEKAQQNAK